MKLIILIGSAVVSLALVAYSIGVIVEFKKKIIVWKSLVFLSVGLFFDITGTVCMIIGSDNPAFTFHGIIGYSALIAMFVDTLLMWLLKLKKGINAQVPKIVHKYTVVAYTWWAIVYLSGFLMAMNK